MRQTPKLILILLLLPMISLALPTDKNKPATIIADSATLNRDTGVGIYKGHVIVTQGSTKLTANKLITYSNKEHKITKAIAFGHPAHYQTQPKPHEKLFHALADQLTYYPNTGIVILIGHGILKQGANIFKAPHIVYNQKQGVLQSLPDKKGRTTIILQPNTGTQQESKQS